ncbi:MAG: hypothetical protein KDA46_14890 [Parvularculaceae bacterium]|nr:hypothetical protein [Parvularculaceae bacterium]
MTFKTQLTALGFLALGACASSPDRGVDVTQAAPETAQGGETDISLGELADSAIPRGECGMILWTLEADRPTAVFRYTSGKKAEVLVNGAPRELALVSARGGASYGVSEQQTFADDAGLTITIKVNFGMGFDGGNYLERTLITVENAAGWRTVIPSAGVAGCRGG